MKAAEFLRRVQRLARSRDLSFHYDPAIGKGSHGRIFVGTRHTTIKDLRKELGEGLLNTLCKQLGSINATCIERTYDHFELSRKPGA